MTFDSFSYLIVIEHSLAETFYQMHYHIGTL